MLRNKIGINIFCGIFLLTTIGCQKAIEQAKYDAAVQLLISSNWYVVQYGEGIDSANSNATTTVYKNYPTAEFTGLIFKFHEDLTVDAINGTTTVTGIWGADASAKPNPKFWATFNTGNPLARLNGTWEEVYYDSQGPKFTQTLNGTGLMLKLRKQ